MAGTKRKMRQSGMSGVHNVRTSASASQEIPQSWRIRYKREHGASLPKMPSSQARTAEGGSVQVELNEREIQRLIAACEDTANLFERSHLLCVRHIGYAFAKLADKLDGAYIALKRRGME